MNLTETLLQLARDPFRALEAGGEPGQLGLSVTPLARTPINTLLQRMVYNEVGGAETYMELQTMAPISTAEKSNSVVPR